ncbi:T9SS type A sorting domain-containing protein, partial [Larkinella knui]
ATYYQDEQIPALLGSIFENNRAVNCAAGLYLNSGSYNTLVCQLQLENTGRALQDDRLERVNHASVATSLCFFNGDEQLEVPMKIYPNPVFNELHIQLATAGARFKVYSIAGLLLINTLTTTNEAHLDVQRLPVGTYLLQVQPDQGETVNQVFIKF